MTTRFKERLKVTTNSIATSFAPRRRVPVIGIIGGIGSGKSAVTNWVAEHSKVLVLDADIIGHEALQVAGVKEALCHRFGAEILGSDGEIVRSELARKVFGSDDNFVDARHDLEAVVHPEIGRRISEQIKMAPAQQCDAVLLDAAVLLEAGWRSKCDMVVFIDTPDAVRLARVRENRSWTEDDLKRRELSQWTLTEKRREADLIVTNDGDLEQSGRQLLESLQQRGLVNIGSPA